MSRGRVYAPRSTDADVERVLVTTLETMPGGCHPLLDKQLGDALRHTPDRDCPDLESLCVAPHRVESFKLPKDPSFIEKVGNIVALYLYPPDRAPPLSAGEKSQIQALDRTAPLRPMGPGRAERHTHDYVAMGPRPCSQRWTSQPDRSSRSAIAAIGVGSSCASRTPSTAPSPHPQTSI